MEGIGQMLIQTTSMLPRPRSESCFSTMETENGDLDGTGVPNPDRSLKRTPKKEKAMTMLNLPLKKKPGSKQSSHHHHNRSETMLSPSDEPTSHVSHAIGNQNKNVFFSTTR